MHVTLRQLWLPCLTFALCTLPPGCKEEPPPRTSRGFGPVRPIETDNERRLKEANAQIIEQLLTAYQLGADPAATVEDQRKAELQLRAAMVRLEYWYTQGGRDFLLGSPDGEQTDR